MKLITNYLTVWITLILITLKLINVIKWSWLWVLSPAWISLTLAALVMLWLVRKK